MVEVLEGSEFLVREHRMRDPETVGVRRLGREQIALRTDVALQSHDHFLPDRIDGGVRDLCEELLEVVVEHPRFVREDGQRGVVAH